MSVVFYISSVDSLLYAKTILLCSCGKTRADMHDCKPLPYTAHTAEGGFYALLLCYVHVLPA